MASYITSSLYVAMFWAEFSNFYHTEVLGWFMSKITKLCLCLLKLYREYCMTLFSGHGVYRLHSIFYLLSGRDRS